MVLASSIVGVVYCHTVWGIAKRSQGYSMGPRATHQGGRGCHATVFNTERRHGVLHTANVAKETIAKVTIAKETVAKETVAKAIHTTVDSTCITTAATAMLHTAHCTPTAHYTAHQNCHHHYRHPPPLPTTTHHCQHCSCTPTRTLPAAHHATPHRHRHYHRRRRRRRHCHCCHHGHHCSCTSTH